MKKIHYLKASEKNNHQSQALLFSKTPMITQSLVEKPEKNFFYQNGYTTLNNIKDYQEAHDQLYQFLGALDESMLILPAGSFAQTQLAKLDCIPLCDEIIQTGFQALHYDMGQPFVNDQDQTLYTIGALYRAQSSDRNQEAKTRIIDLKKLFAQKSFGNSNELRRNLLEYAELHGDGWNEPSPANTKRLACFARVVDALNNNQSLAHERESMIGQCFDYDSNLSGKNGYQHEINFFKAAGIDLEAIEEQIEILPGQMLIYDNMRCVHGRIGKRSSKELFNFLFGIKKASDQQIDAYLDWITEQAS